MSSCVLIARSVCLSFSEYEIQYKPVSDFEVQKKTRRGDWKRATTAKIGPKDTTAKVTGLNEGDELEFRVVAINAAGPGAPSKSTGVHKVRDPVCE